MGGKKEAKKEKEKKVLHQNNNSEQQSSSSGATIESTNILKDSEPILRNFLQHFNKVQSRWNEGWAADQTQRFAELKAEMKKQFDDLHEEQLQLKVSIGL